VSPYSGAKYHAKYKGTVCRIDGITQIGAPASGLRLVG
jgi:coatomer protein complex subunit alpha (xenin)